MTGNKYIIMEALRLSELQYGTLVMDYANLWMARYFGTERLVIDALNSSKSFWRWWTGQWNNRDAEFIRITGLTEITLPLDLTTWKVTKELYEDHHNVDELRIRPNRFVVQEVGKLIRVEENKLKALQKK